MHPGAALPDIHQLEQVTLQTNLFTGNPEAGFQRAGGTTGDEHPVKPTLHHSRLDSRQSIGRARITQSPGDGDSRQILHLFFHNIQVQEGRNPITAITDKDAQFDLFHGVVSHAIVAA
jgi:hypothetical protein